ncbi:hypothetical protein C1H46_041260 [Malus baccata]|uniref:ATP synthase subunit a, chloroplastic n=1 Tax=Malus baccata TaxID=106549 RepID=A0A540KG52_MALBA|nr:hypothetical protein C1H46_041260 [Malus baccata]
MTGLPDIVIIVDQQEEYTALRECITLGIPTICLIDTNCDPDLADISIPANDDAIASIRLILNKLVFAIWALLPWKIIQLPHGELAAPTNDINTTVALALLTSVAYFYAGLTKKGLGYFGKYIQPTPILLPINILEDFTKPLSLSFRLFGNILADELVVVVLVSLVPSVVPIPVMFLGLFTSGIQALIFATLAAAYIGESMEERARLLIVVHPTVQTRPVKNVLAIRQTPDLVLHLKLVQADGATLRRVPGDVAEFDDGEKFLDQEGRRGWVFRQVGSGLRPNDVVGFEKFGETQKVEERENEASDEAEERECVEKEVGEDEDLCVSHWEAHGGALERERERTRVLFLERENADWVYIFEGVL